MINFKRFLSFALLLFLVGCAGVPIMDITDATIVTASGTALSKADVRSAIVNAGSNLGWEIEDTNPDMLVLTIKLRAHMAVIEIPYSATNYSIKYRTSVNLDAKSGLIHKNYNGWIKNLTRDINVQLKKPKA
jgi:hypothetical protein